MSGTNLSGGARHRISQLVYAVRTQLTPVPTVSHFKDQRTLTPAEFVQAGDYLVRAFPSWEWTGGEPSKRQSYLGGEQKQCLVIRKVPANPVAQINSADLDAAQEEGDWVCAGTVSETPIRAEVIADIDLDQDQELAEEDPGALPAELENRRFYDLYVTYDLIYKVPRFWLVGYDAALSPLTHAQVCADVSPEHAGLTLTWDPHPHEAFHAVNIHPCRHAPVMKELLDTMEASGKTVPVDHYMLVFLKFVMALIPTIEYDYHSFGGN